MTEIVPLCASTIVLTLARPSPVPCCFVLNNGSKILEICSCSIPLPESITWIITTSSVSLTEISIVPVPSIA